MQEVENETVEEMKRSWQTLSESLQGAKLDSLIMLIATSAVIHIQKTGYFSNSWLHVCRGFSKWNTQDFNIWCLIRVSP